MPARIHPAHDAGSYQPYLVFRSFRLFRLDCGQLGSAVVSAPCPGIAEPERGKHMDRRCFGSVIGDAHTDEHVERIDFGIFHRDVKVAIFRKNARVDEFVFGFIFPAMAIGFEQDRCRGRRAVDICTRLSCRNGWECCRERNSTPSHPHRDCPQSSSGRRAVPSRWGQPRSKGQGQNMPTLDRH